MQQVLGNAGGRSRLRQLYPQFTEEVAAKAIWPNYPKMQRTTFALKASMLLKIFKEKV